MKKLGLGAAILLIFLLLLVTESRNLGIGNEEISLYLARYPVMVERIEGPNPANDYKMAAPHIPSHGIHFLSSSIWPVYAVAVHGFRIPLFMDVQAAALIDDLFLPLRIVFPWSILAVRSVSVFYALLLMALILFIEGRFSGEKDVLLASALMVLHPVSIFLFAMGYRQESVLPLLTYLVVRMPSLYESSGRKSRLILFAFLLGLIGSAKLHALPVLLPFVVYQLFISKRFSKGLLTAAALALPLFILPLLPHIYLGVTGGFAKAPLDIIGCLSDPIRQIRNSFDSFATLLVMPQLLIRKIYLRTGAPFFSVYSLFAAAAVIRAFVLCIQEFKKRRTSDDSWPITSEEIFTMIVIGGFLVYMVLYKTQMNVQSFFYAIPFFFIIQGRCIVAAGNATVRFMKSARAPQYALLAGFLVFAVPLGFLQYDMHRSRMATDNPMFSLSAQKRLMSYLETNHICVLYTTVQNHAGFIEFMSHENIRPYNLSLLINTSTFDLRRAFEQTFRNKTVPYYLFDAGTNIFVGGNSRKNFIKEMFNSSMNMVGCKIGSEITIRNDAGAAVYYLVRARCPES